MSARPAQFLAIMAMLLLACTKQKAREPAAPKEPVTPTTCNAAYNADIKPLMDLKCAVSGCHTSGASIGELGTYAGLKTRIDNGKINTMVFELKVMPPASAAKLTPNELEMLQCWLSKGALQD